MQLPAALRRIRPRSPERERLLAAIGNLAEEHRAVSPEPGACGTVIESILAKARQALLDGHGLDAGWAYFDAARRVRILDYDPTRVRAEALALEKEADGKIKGWRGKAIVALLQELVHRQQPDGGGAAKLAEVEAWAAAAGTQLEAAEGVAADVAADVAALVGGLDGSADGRVLLYQATLLRDEALQNEYRKLAVLRQQLRLLCLMLGGTLVVLFGLAVSSAPRSLFDATVLAYVAAFGALGGSLSAIQSVIKTSTVDARIPQRRIQGPVVSVRPLFGLAAAVALYPFLRSGLIQLGSGSIAVVIGASFAAGFTERLIAQAVGAVTPKDAQPDG
jgi:hypothetical protein